MYAFIILSICLLTASTGWIMMRLAALRALLRAAAALSRRVLLEHKFKLELSLLPSRARRGPHLSTPTKV